MLHRFFTAAACSSNVLLEASSCPSDIVDSIPILSMYHIYGLKHQLISYV